MLGDKGDGAVHNGMWKLTPLPWRLKTCFGFKKTCILVDAGCSVACLEWLRRMDQKGLQHLGQDADRLVLKPLTAKEARVDVGC